MTALHASLTWPAIAAGIWSAQHADNVTVQLFAGSRAVKQQINSTIGQVALHKQFGPRTIFEAREQQGFTDGIVGAGSVQTLHCRHIVEV